MISYASQRSWSNLWNKIRHIGQNNPWTVLIFKPIFDACKYVDPVDTFQTKLLAWYTVASFGLTPFNADFFDFVEYYIPIKYVTKVNKFIVIVTTNHKF